MWNDHAAASTLRGAGDRFSNPHSQNQYSNSHIQYPNSQNQHSNPHNQHSNPHNQHSNPHNQYLNSQNQYSNLQNRYSNSQNQYPNRQSYSTYRHSFHNRPFHNYNYNESVPFNDSNNPEMNNGILNPLAEAFYPSSALPIARHQAPGTSTYSSNESSSGGGSSRHLPPSGLARGAQNPNLNAVSGDTLRERLDDQLRTGSYECMICCEKIRWKDQIWTCAQCYHVFHLRCVKKWAKTSNLAAEQNGNSNNETTGWRCPGCQLVSAEIPAEYYCFCGREKDPKPARGFDVPHSCGQLCKRRRKPGCFHPCTLLCHPGPCPPCPKIVDKRCDCGSILKQVRCGSDSFQCTKVCDKVLNCEAHTCARVCHSGPCFPCKDEIEMSCFCGKKTRTSICTFEAALNPYFNCGKICNKNLPCENHKCQSKCHSGDCPPCPLDPKNVNSCPCGKTPLGELGCVRQNCLDPLPTCENICGKELNCGPEDSKHKCTVKCHVTSCPPCSLVTKVRCRCGAFNSKVPCIDVQFVDAEHPYLCTRRCGKRKSCKQHKCNEVCCSDFDHLCTQICGKKLSCGVHSCELLCHSGKCRSCQNASFDELRCYCGSSVVYPPVACGTKPPTCDKMCTREHSCSHPVNHNCHSEPFCPPCSYLTQKWCYGGHEMRRNIPCYLNDISCGKMCGKVLPCEQHKCNRVCHAGPCDVVVSNVAENETAAAANPVKCKQPCLAARSHCGHLCGAPCHVGTPCPETPCHTMLSVTCKCGRINGTMTCIEIETFNSNKNVEIADKFKCLSCDDDCFRLERNRRLAKALELEPRVDIEDETPLYTEYLKTHFKTHSEFLIGLEKTFSELIESLETSKSPPNTKTHVFRPMNRDYRRLIHEYAAFFSIETLSYDSDPVRNVMATALRGKSKIPKVLLSTLLLRDVKPVPAVRVAAPTSLNTQRFRYGK